MTSLPDLLRDLGISFRTSEESSHVTRGWYGIPCPWCGTGPSGKHGLGIHQTTLACSCWKCGPHSLAAALTEASGKRFGDIIALLGEVASGQRPERPKGKLTLPAGIGPLLRAHRRYLKGRNFDPDELTRVWGLQGIGPAGKLAWRLFIPIVGGGKVLSWTTRSLKDRGQRYITAPPEQEATPAKSLLYGEDLVPGGEVIVVEGPTDAWRVGPGAVALLGTGFTPAQVGRLVKYRKRVLLFDNEPEAQKRAEKLAAALAPFRGETLIAELDAADPGSASRKEVRLLRKAVLG